MMDIAYEWIGWILIAIGVVGCFLPVLPGPPIAYAALFLALARGDHSSPRVSALKSRITKAVCLIALLGYVCGVVVKVACCGFIAYRFWTAVHGS